MTDSEVRIDHPDLAHLDLTVAIHDLQRDGPVSGSIARTRIWEGFLTRQLIALSDRPEFRSFYDLGANIGWHSLVVAAHLRARGLSGHVVAVEPARANQERLRRSIALNGLDGAIHLVEGAASDCAGRAMLDHDPGNAGNHHLAGSGWPDETCGSREEVATWRLDDLVAARGWPLPTLVKIDVQGHEMQALAGFGDLLDRVPDWILAIEYVPDFWRLEDLVALLRPEGLYQVDEQCRRIVPTSAERLRAIAADWPRGYYDLILTRGPGARAALTALPGHGGLQMRFGAGFGGLTEAGLRWAAPQADCRLDCLTAPAGREVEVTGQVTRRLWDGVIALRVEDAAGRQRLLLKPKTPFVLRCRTGADPVRLRFELRETPGGLRRHPQHAFQLSHLDMREITGD